MCPVSVVIITKNEGTIIGKTLASLAGFSDDIVIVDNGSSDETLTIARERGCRVIETEWQGYGPTKNIGIDAAKYDWILSLDADEVPDRVLLAEIGTIDFSNDRVAYDLDFKTYFGEKRIKFGEWGKDHHVRLVNRRLIRWSDDEVHEQLIFPADITIRKLKGSVHHYTIMGKEELKAKFIRYASLNAQRYHHNNRSSVLKMWVSPSFNFFKNYIFRLGFLDGNEGFIIAKLSAYYTWLKYYRLKQLNRNK